MTSRKGKKKWPSIYTPEEQEKLKRWKERKRRKCMVYIGSAIKRWKEVKAEESLRKDKDLALFLLHLYWKFFKTGTKPSSGIDVSDSQDCSSSEFNEDSNDPASPGISCPVDLPLCSIPSPSPSPVELDICKDALELGEVSPCPEVAVFTSTDPMYGSEHPDNVQTQDSTYFSGEMCMVPEATEEEVVETFIQIEEEPFIPFQEDNLHPIKNEPFHPFEGVELQPTMKEQLNLIKEEILNSNDQEDLHPITEEKFIAIEEEEFHPITDEKFRAIQEEEFHPITDETFSKIKEEDFHPITDETFSKIKEEEFHPITDETFSDIKEEEFHPVMEENFISVKENMAAEQNGCSKHQEHVPVLQNVTLLPQQKEEEEDLLGREFFSWEEFSCFFDSWCEQRKSLFFIQNSIHLSKCKWRTAPPAAEVVNALKYSHVHLLCKETKDFRQKQPGEQNEQKSCSAKIILNISRTKDCLVVTECQLTHSHVLCPITFDTYKKGFLLSSYCLPVHVTNLISRQFLELWDVNRLLSICKSQDQDILEILSALKGLFAEDPKIKVKLVFMDYMTTVKMIYFQNSEMRRFCQRFPSTLFFDRMLGLNKEFDLYSILCIDDNNQGRECGHCLARKGTSSMLRATLASLLQTIPELKVKVKYMTVGADVDELEAVRQMLPQSRVQICRSQVLETLSRKACEIGALQDEKAQPLLCELIWSKSIDMYNQVVKKMAEVFSQQFMNYFWAHWHPRSTLWAECFIGKIKEVINTCDAIKEHQQKLSRVLHPSPTVAQCLTDLMAVQAAKMEAGYIDAVAARYRTICQPEQANLIEEELALANLTTYDIKENLMTFVLNDGVSSFTMNHKLTSCNCSIYTSNLLPCRHLFATRFLTGHTLFDAELLVKKERALSFLQQFEA